MTPRRALAIALLLGASGCDRERSTWTLSIGLDSEDRAGQKWLGQWPASFEAVFACPQIDAPPVQMVTGDARVSAIEQLDKEFAVKLSPGSAYELTGQLVPKLSAVQQQLMNGQAYAQAAQEAAKRLSKELLGNHDGMTAVMDGTSAAMSDIAKLQQTGQQPWLMRAVVFDPTVAPSADSCVGEVNLRSFSKGPTVPKYYRWPVVVWLVTAPKRGRVDATLSK